MAKKKGRERTLTDEEIGLIKAMLAKGMKNDEAHFYFNRADRLISTGRITQIKQGQYGAAVPVATPAELGTFISNWQSRQLTGAARGPASPTDPETIIAMFMETQGVWTLRLGETDQAECKQNFRLMPEERFADVIKTIAGFANNKGGHVLFGVNDKTQSVDGLTAEYFVKTDPADINRCLAGALDPVPHVTKTSVTIGGKTIGALYVEKHENAPVIALKNIGGGVFKEGTIYYRYVGETRSIKPGELRKIIANREQRAVAEFTRRMNQIASGAAATVDLDTGQVTGRSGSFVIDEDLLPSIQFIREGEFSEVKGAPALRLIGDVEPVSDLEKERARIIRENVTPDAVISNFLKSEKVYDPMQYIHAQAHCQRKWLPVWYYVAQADRKVDAIVDDLMARVSSLPSSRAAVVKRLRREESAHKVHLGRPARILEGFTSGVVVEPKDASEVLPIANAIMGLPAGTTEVEKFKPIVLACLERMDGEGANNGTRSAIYRAACRLDELLHATDATNSPLRQKR